MNSEINTPQPNANQVQIRLVATSVNPIDTKFRCGAVGNLQFPALLHSDFAGYITQVGELVEGLNIGDAVFGNAGAIAGTGALAEYCLADARLVAKAPDSIPLWQAAAVPLVGITAWEALFDKGQIRPWHQVLIQGGAGGVGHIATQLAIWAGCEVWASASAAKSAIIKNYGAHAIDYRQIDNFDAAKSQTFNGAGFDLVFDTVGQQSLDTAINMAKNCATVVGIAGRSSHNLQALHEKNLDLKFEFKTIGTMQANHRAHQGWIVSQLARLIDNGRLVPLIDKQCFTLAQVSDAHDYLSSGAATGKVIIKIADT